MRQYGKKVYILVPLLSALFGALTFLWVYGWQVIIPTYTDWVMMGAADTIQHYIGWGFFRNSQWLFPIGMMDTLPYPYMSSVVFTDSIPWFAVLFKLLSPLLPESFQYFGIWGLLCYMLQGALGALLCLKYAKTPVQAAAGSLLFVLTPIMLVRMFLHTALGGQWIILLAMVPFVYHEELGKSKTAPIVFWAVVGALAAGIHQYFIAICGILCAGHMLRTMLGSKGAQKKAAALLLPLIFILSAGLADALLGAFSLSASDAGEGGLGTLNFNLNGFWNSLGYSVLVPGLPLYGSDQGEGLAYLGIGVFALFGIAILSLITGYIASLFTKKKAASPLSVVRGHWKVIVSVAATVLVCLLMATVPLITYGDKLLLEIKLPSIIESALSIFRASGRFAWPVFYMIILAGVALLMRKTWKWLAVIVLIGCVGLQFYDFSNETRNKNAFYNQRHQYVGMVDTADWDALSADDNILHLVASPSVGGNNNATFRLAAIAQQNKWTISHLWFARTVAPTWDTWPQSMADPQDDSLFVFSYVDRDDVLDAGFQYIYELEDGMFAALTRPGPDGLQQITQKELQDYTFSYSYSFARNASYLSNGEDIGGVRYLYENGWSGGPYMTLGEGAYEITITGDNLDVLNVKCFDGKTQFDLLDLRVTPTGVSAKIIVPSTIYGLEIEISNPTHHTVAIASLSMKAIPLDSIEYSTFRSYAFNGRTAFLSGGEDIDGVRYLHKDGVSYGPYWALPAGAYLITIEGSNLDLVDTDCVPQFDKEAFTLLDYRATPTEITYKIIAEEPINSLETRVFNHTGETVTLTSITAASIDEEDIEHAYFYYYSFIKNAENMDNGEDIDGIRYLHTDGISYGPYIELPAGAYDIVVTGTGLDGASADCAANHGQTSLPLLNYLVTPEQITYRIVVEAPVSGLETRIFNHSEDTISIESITISSAPSR